MTDRIKAWLILLFLHLTIAQYDRDRGPLGGLTMFPKILIEYTLYYLYKSSYQVLPTLRKKEFPIARSYNLSFLCCVLAAQCSLHPRLCKQREDLVQDHKGLCCNNSSVYPILQSYDRVENNFLLHKITWHFLEDNSQVEYPNWSPGKYLILRKITRIRHSIRKPARSTNNESYLFIYYQRSNSWE